MSKIQDVRLKRGLLQYWVADKIGIGPYTLSLYENGRREVPAEVLRRLAELYKVSVEDLAEDLRE